MSNRTEMISINRYSHRDGYFGGYPTFFYKPANYYNYLTVVKLKDHARDYKDIPAPPQLMKNPEHIPLWLRELNLYARDRHLAGGDYVGALPTFEQAKPGDHIVIGINFLHREAADFQSIYINELIEAGINYNVFGSYREQFKAIHEFAVHKGYESGLPIYTEADPREPRERGNLVQILLFKKGYVEVEEIPEHLEHIHWNYTFNEKKIWSELDLSDDFILRIYKSITIALNSINNCSHLSIEECKTLIEGVRKFLHFSALATDDPYRGKVDSESKIHVGLRESYFFSTGNEENDQNLLAETVLHEFMYVAGYTHILYEEDRFEPHKGCGCGDDNDRIGVPDDAVSYWTSVPSRAECCIRGMQGGRP